MKFSGLNLEPMKPRRHIIGVDLGQRRDPTAVVVLELAERQIGFDHGHFVPVYEQKWVVRMSERWALGTHYTDVAWRLDRLVHSPELWETSTTLVVDGTGVGAPVVEMLQNARIGAPVKPVWITGGARERESGEGWWNVPRRDLLQGVLVMLDRRILKIDADWPGYGELVEEMKTVTEKAGSVRDDLAMALGLACWDALNAPAPKTYGRVGNPRWVIPASSSYWRDFGGPSRVG